MDGVTIKSFVGKVMNFASRNGYDQLRVLEDLLDYTIGQLSVEPYAIPGWEYSQEQNQFFFEMMLEYLALCENEMQIKGWYDAWGDLFMELKGNSAGYRNQFFTPPCMADLASLYVKSDNLTDCKTFGQRLTISDLTCGSGRILLAAHWNHVKKGGKLPYLIAEDIDAICCKMTAVNLAIHGCYGEVICHDSLMKPKSINAGYIINEGLHPIREGIPSIRRTTDTERFVFDFSEEKQLTLFKEE